MYLVRDEVKLKIKIYSYITKFMIEFYKVEGSFNDYYSAVEEIIGDPRLKDLEEISPFMKPNSDH